MGDELAARAEPVSERDGEVIVECADAVWAQELDLMQAQLLERLRERLGEAGAEESPIPYEPGPFLVSLNSQFAGLLLQTSRVSEGSNWYPYVN